MKQFLKIAAISASMLVAGAMASGCSSDKEQPAGQRPSTKRERNYMKEGKSLFDKQRYAEAEVNFKKALGENPDNARAQFNLASSYLKQRGEDLANKGDSLIRQADQILAQTAGNPDIELAQQSFYDRGNIAYKGEDYGAAIEMYKNALRRNPEDNQARENLRLAQLKKQQQDQNKDDKQDQNQDQNQNQDQQNQDKQQQQQQEQQGGLSEQSAAQILKAMDAKESATRMKVEQMKQSQEKQSRQRQTGKPW